MAFYLLQRKIFHWAQDFKKFQCIVFWIKQICTVKVGLALIKINLQSKQKESFLFNIFDDVSGHNANFHFRHYFRVNGKLLCKPCQNFIHRRWRKVWNVAHSMENILCPFRIYFINQALNETANESHFSANLFFSYIHGSFYKSLAFACVKYFAYIQSIIKENCGAIKLKNHINTAQTSYFNHLRSTELEPWSHYLAFNQINDNSINEMK